MHFYFACRYTKLRWVDFIPVKCLIASVVMFLVVYFTYSNDYPSMFCLPWALIGMVTYVAVLVILRDKYLKETFLKLIRR